MKGMLQAWLTQQRHAISLRPLFLPLPSASRRVSFRPRLGVLPHGPKVAARNRQSGSILVRGPQRSFLSLSSEQGGFVPGSLQQTPELALTCPSPRPDHSDYLDKLALRSP